MIYFPLGFLASYFVVQGLRLLLPKPNSRIVRLAIALPLIGAAYIAGLIAGFLVVFVALWAPSGLPLSEFWNAPIAAGDYIANWLGKGSLGCFTGALVAACKNWPERKNA